MLLNLLPHGTCTPPLPRLDSSLEWVTLLTPEALDAFLVEKLEARRALVELDLEPSGLVIKHDDDGEVERVEPAVVAEKVRAGRRLLLSGAGFLRRRASLERMNKRSPFVSGVFSGFVPRVNSRRALAHPFGPRERVACFRPTFSGVCALFFGAFSSYIGCNENFSVRFLCTCNETGQPGSPTRVGVGFPNSRMQRLYRCCAMFVQLAGKVGSPDRVCSGAISKGPRISIPDLDALQP